MFEAILGSTLFKVVAALIALPGPSPFSIIAWAFYRWFSGGRPTPAALGSGPAVKALEAAPAFAASILVLAPVGSPDRQASIDAAVNVVRNLAERDRIAGYSEILRAGATEQEIRRSLGLV